MEVETYAAPGMPTNDSPEKAPSNVYQIRPKGLRTTSGGDLEMVRQVFGHELTPKEFKTWKSFLPTSYSLQRGQYMRYVYDRPPQETLDAIHNAKNMQVFNDIEIWTPEARYDDPAAVGVLRPLDPAQATKYFLIARWAESLASYSEIQRKVRWIRFVRCLRVALLMITTLIMTWAFIVLIGWFFSSILQ